MISNVFTLVLATASIANAIPLFRGEPAPAQQLVRRAENNGQIAQGSNFYFQSLHIEDSCTPGQVACVSGSYATCSPEANWEIQPCSTGTTCLAVPADSSSGVTVQCTTQDAATASINNAGGETNVIAADYHIVDAPFHAAIVPTATESVAVPTATESASATENTSTESASATESASTEDPSGTCIPDDEDPTATETPTPTATEAPVPDETCTEDPVETETITVILVPVPSQSGVFSTTTLFPEETAAPTETVSSSSASETASSDSASETASSSDSSSASETASSTEAAPTEVYSYPGADPTPTESPASDSASATEAPSSDNNSSSSSSITPTTLIVPPPPAPTESVTSITISFPADGSAPSIPPVNAPTQPTPPVVVVGIHFIPAGPAAPAPTAPSGAVPVKRGMQKKIRRV